MSRLKIRWNKALKRQEIHRVTLGGFLFVFLRTYNEPHSLFCLYSAIRDDRFEGCSIDAFMDMLLKGESPNRHHALWHVYSWETEKEEAAKIPEIRSRLALEML